MPTIDWASVAQMTTAMVAVTALIVGPSLSFRSSRRLAVTASRQKWLDELRTDVAELVSLCDAGLTTVEAAHDAALPPADFHHRRLRLDLVRARIRLRLNGDRPDHCALLTALTGFLEAGDTARGDAREQVWSAFRPVMQGVWDDIRKGSI